MLRHFVCLLLCLGSLTCGKPKGDAVIAMITLDKPTLPDPTALQSALIADWKASVRVSGITLEKDVLTFHINDAVAAVGLMQAPIPWGELEGPCATASRWPNACDALRAHKAHIIVTVMGGNMTPLARTMLVTNLTATLLNLTQSSGVYWGAGTVLSPPNAFRTAAAGMTPDALPLSLWIDFRDEALDNGEFRYFTTGLSPLVQKEIEVPKSPRPPKDSLELIFLFAHYLITESPHIKDGDTFGRNATEKIKVRLDQSMFPGRAEVIQLVL